MIDKTLRLRGEVKRQTKHNRQPRWRISNIQHQTIEKHLFRKCAHLRAAARSGRSQGHIFTGRTLPIADQKCDQLKVAVCSGRRSDIVRSRSHHLTAANEIRRRVLPQTWPKPSGLPTGSNCTMRLGDKLASSLSKIEAQLEHLPKLEYYCLRLGTRT